MTRLGVHYDTTRSQVEVDHTGVACQSFSVNATVNVAPVPLRRASVALEALYKGITPSRI